ncbi:MAG: ribonuclease HII [Eubacterium sp.]|nr:ribonuclease HII [Eubacterium sp.]
MNICEIRNKMIEIAGLPIMKYEEKKNRYNALVEEISGDDRKGVISLKNKAEQAVKKIDEEILRVKNMMYFENKYSDYQYICGTDEVGRGPLAGPIVTAAVILPKGLVIPFLNDSKQVKPAMREELYDIIMSNAVAVGLGMNTEKYIDTEGIQKANYDAMCKAVNNLNQKPDLVLVDAVKLQDLDIKQISIVKGDALSVSIAAASIIAKVTRDRLMKEYDEKYPEYDFKNNMGYGSPKHLEALRKIGPCEIHRRSFIKNYV